MDIMSDFEALWRFAESSPISPDRELLDAPINWYLTPGRACLNQRCRSQSVRATGTLFAPPDDACEWCFGAVEDMPAGRHLMSLREIVENITATHVACAAAAGLPDEVAAYSIAVAEMCSASAAAYLVQDMTSLAASADEAVAVVAEVVERVSRLRAARPYAATAIARYAAALPWTAAGAVERFAALGVPAASQLAKVTGEHAMHVDSGAAVAPVRDLRVELLAAAAKLDHPDSVETLTTWLSSAGDRFDAALAESGRSILAVEMHDEDVCPLTVGEIVWANYGSLRAGWHIRVVPSVVAILIAGLLRGTGTAAVDLGPLEADDTEECLIVASRLLGEGLEPADALAAARLLDDSVAV